MSAIRERLPLRFCRYKGITQEYYEQLYCNKIKSLDEINKFLEKHNL